jgi:hypothetical protein
LLYKAGVCSAFAEILSSTSATSLTSPMVCSSFSRNAWNSGRISCGELRQLILKYNHDEELTLRRLNTA